MISEKLVRSWYPDEKFNGTMLFYDWLRKEAGSCSTVLNLGAGPAGQNPHRIKRGEVARIVGADIDPVVLRNSEVDESHLVDGKTLPFGNASFDIVFCDYVLEHVEFPEEFLKEVHRVLKPGGSFFFRTPNKHHYVSLIARTTPHWFHELVANRVRGLPAGAHEPYATFHRLNSGREIAKLARVIGFSEIELRYVECEPSYLKFSTITFLAGALYERIINRFEALSGLRANIFGRLIR